MKNKTSKQCDLNEDAKIFSLIRNEGITSLLFHFAGEQVDSYFTHLPFLWSTSKETFS